MLQALIGFGRSTHLHRPHDLGDDQSLVIEIVYREDRLRGFVASLGDIEGIGLVTMKAVELLKISGGAQHGA